MIEASSSLRPSAVNTAPAGIEVRIVLEHANRRLHRVEARAAGGQHLLARGQRRGQSGAIRGFLLRREIAAFDDAGAAVNRQRPTSSWQETGLDGAIRRRGEQLNRWVLDRETVEMSVLEESTRVIGIERNSSG